MPNGEWRFFDENGVIMQKGKYLNNLEDGFWQLFDEDGNLKVKQDKK